jgi:hypothetical protein
MIQPRLLIRTVSLVAVLLGAAGGSPPLLHAQEPPLTTRAVQANQPAWTDTGITLAADERVTITATGTPSWDGGRTVTGPEGVAVQSCATIAPALPIGALLARLSGGVAVLATAAPIDGPGRLELAYNDCPDQYFDNGGAFAVTLGLTRPQPASAAPRPTAEPELTAADELPAGTGRDSAGWLRLARWLLLVPAAGLVAGLGVLARRTVFAPRWRFDPTARLESSAWLAPVRLRELQGERFPRQSLTLGGPDADIDFGLPGVRARFVPTPDGATRLLVAGEGGQIFVNNQAVILGKRLVTRQRVRIGSREFVYLEERDLTAPTPHGGKQTGGADDLGKPDPRAA